MLLLNRSSSLRKEGKGQSMQEKDQQTKALIDLLKTVPSMRAPDMLFGYTLASSAVSLFSREAWSLRKQF